MANNIKGKNILLLCENFYDYDKAIRDELLKMGANMVFLKNANFLNNTIRSPKSFNLITFIKSPFKTGRWTRELKKQIKGIHFDLFLCIENTCFAKSFMKHLRKHNKDIKTALFLWDTYSTQQGGYKDYRFLFDKVYSFDRDDAMKYGMEYFPDFYLPFHQCEEKYEACFIGTANHKSTSHRLHIISKLNRIFVENNINAFLYVKCDNVFNRKRIKKWFCFRKYINEIRKFQNEGFIYFEPLPLEKVNEIMASSQIIIDVNHKNRQGMTLNVISALASGKKLITTNQRIAQEPFYNPNNICIINEYNPVIPKSFLKSKAKPCNLNNLRLDNWLNHILDFSDPTNDQTKSL